jgi:AcrR family transcriptional regulator
MNQVSSSDKTPKTARGKRTLEKLLQAAEIEFGEKGYHAAAISGITYRAGVALGTFYTYFESKEEIFRALVSFMSLRTRRWIAEQVADAPDRMTAERKGIEAYIEFVRRHKGIYRIITESEFVANEAYREHYSGFAKAYEYNLKKAAERNDIRQGDYEVWSWAIMGIALTLGIKYGEWEEHVPASEVAESVADLIEKGMKRIQEPV